MTPPPERLAEALADRYRIERELGGGGMSRVFLAREQGLDRQVVIKVLSSGVAAEVSLERFAREIQMAASLQQANIVPLLSAGNADGAPYYTMPFVQGESLRRRLSDGPALSLRECIGVLRDVARALSYAHAHGVVHRDIKPDNVLLSHGAAVVTDFGIAKAVSSSRTLGDQAMLTQAGLTIGTPAYMAPEQVAGDPKVDHRADLYAWGCLAYEMLAGQPPFVSDSPHRLLAAHLSEAPRPIDTRRPDLPPALARLVMRCLAKDPEERPVGADELLRELDAVATPGDLGSAVGTGGARPAVLRRRLGLVAGVMVATAAVVFLLIRSSATAGRPVSVADRSVAVLPLANLSGNPEDDYFGIGLAEEMTRALAKAGVRVIGRVSAGALQARGLDERAIAEELGVGSLLTGSVQRAAGQVRIRVALSAADGSIRWGQAYDRPIANVFAVQDEIAREVARELLGSLGGAPAGRLVRDETADAVAHSLLLQGIVLWNRRTGPAIRQAIGLFEQAVARDPGYARAHAWLAVGNNTLVFYDDVDTEAYLKRALASAERALALDSTVAEAHASAGLALMTLNRNREAEHRLQRALALDSTLAASWGWSGILAGRHGDFAEARRRISRAIELEPAAMISRVQIAQILILERRYADADTATSRTIALDSSFAMAWHQRAEALAGLGRTDEAIEIMERRVVGLAGVRPSEVNGLLAWMLARGGRAPEARAVLARMGAAYGGRMPPVAVAAAALEELGDHDAAVALFTEAVAQHDPWLWYSRKERYDRLRADPRVAALLVPLESW